MTQTLDEPELSEDAGEDALGLEESLTPILDHLEKLRGRIFRSGAALIAGVLVGFVLVHYYGLIRILIRPIAPFLDHQDGRLSAFSPLTPFLLELKVAVLVGVILAFPVLVYQVWAHLSPMLDKDQRRVIIPSLYGGIVLFGVGVVTAYMILPYSLKWLFAFQEESLNLVIGADDYFGFVVRLLIAFGFVFELPVVVMILTVLGIVTPKYLRDKRRHAIVGITVLSSLITPGDLASTFLMMVPMMVLYEVSIVLATTIKQRQRAPTEA